MSDRICHLKMESHATVGTIEGYGANDIPSSVPSVKFVLPVISA